MTEMKNKKIAIIGCGSEGRSLATLETIRRAEALGVEVVHISSDDAMKQGLEVDAIFYDEAPRGLDIRKEPTLADMNIEETYKRNFDFIRPVTRTERRAKRPRKKKSKF